MTQEASIRFENCLMTGNSGEAGVVASRKTGNIELLNCTIADNDSDGIVMDSKAVVTLQNTALYNPDHNEYVSLAADAGIFSNGGNLVWDASLNDILLPLLDKPEIDPMFENGFYPSQESPLVNGGVNGGVTAEYDLDGNPRKQGFVDIGAYESSFYVAVQDVLAETPLRISPNPAVEKVHLEFPEGVSGQALIEIFDIKGQLLIQTNQISGKGIEIKDLPSGVYLLKTMMGGRCYAAKFNKN